MIGEDDVKFDINQLVVKPLPTAVVIKNFIKGLEADPEEYFTDFINSSKLVWEKGNEVFVLRKHEEQSQRQCDIYNSMYELDFKFLVDAKYMEGKRLFSNSITEISTGVTMVGAPEKTGCQKAYYVFMVLRNKSEQELVGIEKGDVKNAEDRVIREILRKALIDKNIMFFLPFNFTFEDKVSIEESVDLIINCIANDFKELIQFRRRKVQKDTYFAFISDGSFVLAKEKNGMLECYDIIDTNVSQLYQYLIRIGRY